MHLKRLLLIAFLLLLIAPAARAQSSMTDKQVMEFIIKENERGTDRNEIVTKLIERGVSIEQIRRIRDKYEKEQAGGQLGAKDLSGARDVQRRLRENNGDKRRKNDEADRRRRQFEERVDESTLSDYERRRLQYDREDALASELDFILPDSLSMYKRMLEEERGEGKSKIKVFGRDIFNQEELSFEPNMNIATPADYQLGPGDEVFIDIWGASQKTVSATISPEGEVDVEDYGPIHLGGLTVEEANARLRATLGRSYGGSQIKLSVGQTRTMSVNVMGEVVAPGTYTISAFATVFHALYMAGGVNDIGTLRDIKVYRNNRLITSVDIYDYILNGKLTGNIRLAPGDVIVVGPYSAQVNITGKVKRPMFYEMKRTESVGTLIKYAGGFTGDAYEGTVRLIRKKGGEHSIYSLDEFERSTFQLEDGDSLSVDSVLTRFRNMVEVRGAVFRPGMYQVGGNISTVRQLLERAGGVTEDAFTVRAVMHRRKPDRTLEVIPVDVEGILQHKVADISLKNEDVLFIPSLEDAREERTLSIYGEVNYPGVYDYADNTTLEDFILQAGGLKDAASLIKVDVSRRIKNQRATKASNIIAQSFTFSLKDGFVIDGKSDFVLQPFDEVFVRKSPGYVAQQHVSIEGEVAFSGTYALTEKGLRLSDLVNMAGGLSSNAYPQGARLERALTEQEKLKREATRRLLEKSDTLGLAKIELGNTRYVGINLDKALENPGDNQWDIILTDGDRLIIPQFNNTVTINGEVMYPNTVAYKPGENLDYYINQAGGFSLKAKKRKVYAINMNGTITRVRKAKDLQPGCEIVVPKKEEKKGMSLTEILSLGSMTATLATVLVTLFNR